MATMNVVLPDPMKTWVESQIRNGHYSDVSDYVRDLIRRDQDYQDNREILVQALVVGENSGESEQTTTQIWQAVKAQHGLGS